MRYIGNKEKLLEHIYSIFCRDGVRGDKFFDFFAGTTTVGRFFKSLRYEVESSDVLYLSYCLQKAYIENNSEPTFDRLLKEIDLRQSNLFTTPLEYVLEYLNEVEDVEGFISKNYTPNGTRHLDSPRMYFSDENGLRIDAVRIQIEKWKEEKFISDNEYYILLACLIESVSFYANVAGVYAAFHKKWDPRAVKRFRLRPIMIYDNARLNHVHCQDSMELIPTIKTDILYLDPPYNERQYLPNYHIIETIAKYDSPEIHGITGMRSYKAEKSTFCNAKTALRDLNDIAANADYRYLVLSYNSEGIMSTDEIMETLGKFGRVSIDEIQYLRFKSNNNGESNTKKHINEQLFVLRR